MSPDAQSLVCLQRADGDPPDGSLGVLLQAGEPRATSAAKAKRKNDRPRRWRRMGVDAISLRKAGSFGRGRGTLALPGFTDLVHGYWSGRVGSPGGFTKSRQSTALDLVAGELPERRRHLLQLRHACALERVGQANSRNVRPGEQSRRRVKLV
jgi:hypothetical protein